jgi:hypothetical protein
MEIKDYQKGALQRLVKIRSVHFAFWSRLSIFA